MEILIDTHTLIWFLEDDPQLSKKASETILLPSNKRFTSIASIWEIVIKTNLGKLALNSNLATIRKLLEENDIHLLPIHYDSLFILERLPLHHRDPFDRIIIAQSIGHQLKIVSKDAAFDNYLVDRLW